VVGAAAVEAGVEEVAAGAAAVVSAVVVADPVEAEQADHGDDFAGNYFVYR